MSTAIEWTDETWNPTTGCTKVSAGCKHCYAERLFPRPYPGRKFTDVQFHPERLDQPLRWRKPRRIFINSMSDLFHEKVPDAFIDQVFAVMARCPNHQFQILTKRSERMHAYAAQPATANRVWEAVGPHPMVISDWPLLNVWLGVSVEDQETVDERIPLLLQTPAAVRFLSCEPLLDKLTLWPWLGDPKHYRITGRGRRKRAFGAGEMKNGPIFWVIVGGESGPRARPCEVAWVRKLVRQCQKADVPCFVKQLGTHPVEYKLSDGDVYACDLKHPKGADMAEWPEDLRVREFPR